MTNSHKLIRRGQHHGKTGKENSKTSNPDFCTQHFAVDSGNDWLHEDQSKLRHTMLSTG